MNIQLSLILIFSPFILTQFMTPEQMRTYRKFLSNQDKLFDDLFRDYEPGNSAVYTLYDYIDNETMTHPPKFEIKIGLSMLKLVEVVEPEEKVTFLFDYTAGWYDPRLSWDPAKYGGINHIYVPRGRVWVPEVTIVDCTEVRIFEDDNTKFAWINANGSVGIYMSSVTSVICEMDVYKFPMDKHTCSVNMLFHTYLTNEYGIEATYDGVLPRPVHQLGNGEWQMQTIQLNKESVREGTVVLNKFEATFSRNPGFYIALVMIPAYFINVLSIIALFINIDDRAEKYSIGMTNIMSMSFILIILAEDLPKTRNLPLLAIYTITSLAIMLCSLCAVALLPKMKAWWAEKMMERGVKPVKLEKPPKDCWGMFKFYFKVEYVFMTVFQIANFVNFIIIFF